MTGKIVGESDEEQWRGTASMGTAYLSLNNNLKVSLKKRLPQNTLIEFHSEHQNIKVVPANF